MQSGRHFQASDLDPLPLLSAPINKRGFPSEHVQSISPGLAARAGAAAHHKVALVQREPGKDGGADGEEHVQRAEAQPRRRLPVLEGNLDHVVAEERVGVPVHPRRPQVQYQRLLSVVRPALPDGLARGLQRFFVPVPQGTAISKTRFWAFIHPAQYARAAETVPPGVKSAPVRENREVQRLLPSARLFLWKQSHKVASVHMCGGVRRHRAQRIFRAPRSCVFHPLLSNDGLHHITVYRLISSNTIRGLDRSRGAHHRRSPGPCHTTGRHCRPGGPAAAPASAPLQPATPPGPEPQDPSRRRHPGLTAAPAADCLELASPPDSTLWGPTGYRCCCHSLSCPAPARLGFTFYGTTYGAGRNIDAERRVDSRV